MQQIYEVKVITLTRGCLLYTSCGADCFYPVYEPVLLDSLPDDLLSAPALQCRDRAEKRHIPDCFVSNLCRLLCSYAASYADYDLWNNDYRILCALQYCRQYFGIPPCAENLQA